MLTRRVVAALLALSSCLGTQHARAESAGANALGTLFYIEIVADVCGLEFGEDRETDLDNAQHKARLSANLSLGQASAVYREVRQQVSTKMGEICRADVQPEIETLLQQALSNAG
jgi:hypothetical protein